MLKILPLFKASKSAYLRAKVLLSDYVSDLRPIASDVAEPYRNFLHWNLSKLAIFLYALAAGFVASIPFLAGMGLI